MGGWFDFVLERYNYWIVIILMMMGLYIVFARGNLVKKIVGLTLFQTSVFIFYITMGKIAGGTAPIYMGGELDHGSGPGEGASAEAAGAVGAGLHDAPAAGQELSGAGLHDKIANDLPGNDLKSALEALGPAEGPVPEPSLHLPSGDGAEKIANDVFLGAQNPDPAGFDIQGGLHDGAANALAEAAAHAPIVYTNPLPHVLILTAIVVGVATTAVGLALAIRIREAYGTIEEDELEAIDNIAEFGDAAKAGGADA